MLVLLALEILNAVYSLYLLLETKSLIIKPPCLKENEKCTQLCNLPRESCGHPCGSPCHDGECPQTPCKNKVYLSCGYFIAILIWLNLLFFCFFFTAK